MDTGSILVFWGTALVVDTILLYIVVLLMIKYGIDPNKQRKRILLKIEKLPEYEEFYDYSSEYNRLVKRIDKLVPPKSFYLVEAMINTSFVGFCTLCGAKRGLDAVYCQYCGNKYIRFIENEV